MGAKASTTTIGHRLNEFQIQMAAQGGLQLVPRKQNLDVVASMGLTISEVERVILDLTEENYSEGPNVMQGGEPGGIWFLAHLEDGHSLYMELKLDAVSAKCLSLHVGMRSVKRHYK